MRLALDIYEVKGLVELTLDMSAIKERDCQGFNSRSDLWALTAVAP